MYIEIENKKYSVEYSFSKKVSELRKKTKLKIKINFYLDENDSESNKRYEKLQNLKELPELLYFTNNYYWWIFDGAKLENKKIVEDKSYREIMSQFYSTRKDQRKFTIEIDFTFTNVYGTNNKTVFDRDWLLKNILG